MQFVLKLLQQDSDPEDPELYKKFEYDDNN